MVINKSLQPVTEEREERKSHKLSLFGYVRISADGSWKVPGFFKDRSITVRCVRARKVHSEHKMV